VEHGSPYTTWEGIGTGWFHSILGGGGALGLRPVGLHTPRTDVSQDNPSLGNPLLPNPVTDRMRGDFAVPTLFNGNFDAVYNPKDDVRNLVSKAIPGWSFHNSPNPSGVNTDKLVNWQKIAQESSGFGSYLSSLNIDPAANGAQSNYALQLNDGDSITHNRFVVPDWGALRFDLHTGDVEKISTNTLTITLRAADGTTETQVIKLQEAVGSASEYANDRWRIGYGETGFETFTIDVPDEFRGKVATVSFELSGGNPVYLDNVFFKSQHLLLGNPTLNGQEARPNVSTNANNFLIEKPQYSLSYDNSDRGPNWVSYQLNRTWLGNLRRPSDSWKPDPQLPSTLPATTTENYANLAGDEQIHRGHMVTQSHRDRTRKEQQATFLTSSMLPQQADNNSDVFKSAWLNLENYAREQLVLTNNKELYIISGGFGSRNSVLSSNHPLNQNGINYPSATWKVIVVLEPGQGVADINANTRIISVVTPNTEKPSDPVQLERWRNWENWLYSVDFIEEQTGLDLLTNIPRDLQDQLESRVDGGINAPLLAESLVGHLA
jgi:DNA/RNA endonuclease G (NUC1)